MREIAIIAICVAAAAMTAGCATVSGGNGMAAGGIYSSYKMGGAVGTGNGAKTGEACASSILGLVATGDASIATAKAAGGIAQVAHVDHEIFSVLGIYGKTCTIVVGQ